MDLTGKKCQPCRGGIDPLDEKKAREMIAATPEWELSEDARKISRRFKCKNFREAVALVNRVADLAEAEGHHPDIRIHGWNKVDFKLYTHKIGGLHENDFIMAAKIGEILNPNP